MSRPKALVLPGPAQSGTRDGATPGWADPRLAIVANRPLISFALESLESGGVRDVVVAVDRARHQAVEEALDEIRAPNLRVVLVEEADGQGLGGTLQSAAEVLDDSPLVVHTGDSLALAGLHPHLDSLSRDGLDGLVLLHPPPGDHGDAVVGLTQRRLRRVVERLTGSRAHLLPAGVYLFAPDVARRLASVDPDVPGELGVAALLERLLEDGGQVGARRVDTWWRYRPQPSALLEANRMALDGMPYEDVESPPGCTVEGAVLIEPSAELRGSTIRGPAVIGARARIEHSYIGPYTSVGTDVVVEGAELENSIVLPGATVANIGYRVEGSVIGRRARVRRDFRLPSAVRLCVGEGADVSLA